MATIEEVGGEGRRARQRRATMRELKVASLDEVREHGAAGLRVRSVARRVGMSAAGVYRYVSSREELLTILIADGYHDLADHLRLAGRGEEEGRPPDSPVTDRPAPVVSTRAPAAGDVAERARAVALAYRRWAIDHPNEFALLFGDPIPGYAAPAEGPTTQGMRRVGAAFAEPLLAAWREERLRVHRALSSLELGEALAPMTDDAVGLGGSGIPPAVHALLLTTWGRVHGQVTLEVFGHHDWIFPAGCEPLFEAEVEALLTDLGLLPEPAQ